MTGAGWGPWQLDPNTFELDTASGTTHGYPINLLTYTNSAEVLDWICQVAGKTWNDDAAPSLGSFVPSTTSSSHRPICAQGVNRDGSPREGSRNSSSPQPPGVTREPISRRPSLVSAHGFVRCAR